MCGICGVGFVDRGKYGLDDIQGMMSILSHRGPDGSGSYSAENILLGHVRLSVIDRSGGIQPMTSDNGLFAIIFNGEIYNFQELKNTYLNLTI